MKREKSEIKFLPRVCRRVESVGEEAKKVGEEESDDGDYVRGGEGRRDGIRMWKRRRVLV